MEIVIAAYIGKKNKKKQEMIFMVDNEDELPADVTKFFQSASCRVIISSDRPKSFDVYLGDPIPRCHGTDAKEVKFEETGSVLPS